MKYSGIEEWKCDRLRSVLREEFGLTPAKTKTKMIDQIFEAKHTRYSFEKQLGDPGKDAVTWQVNMGGKKFALKQFKPQKSEKKIRKEVELQTLAANAGIAPKIHDVDYDRKYIVMDKLDKHLVEVGSDKLVADDSQRQLVNLYNKLDDIGVFHGDPNPLNYMFKRKKLYVIDFGMSSVIDSKLKKKLATETPNADIMALSMVLKLKKIGFPEQSYSILAESLPTSRKEQFGL
jgi:tRNA A-37 threonylcarbamoyl transferase component Bud32